jgi:hypothetical protein
VHGQVTVTIQRLAREVDMEAEMQNLKEAIPGSTVRPASGVGTKAFYLDIPDAGTQLHVIRGTRDHLLISVLGFGSAAEVSSAAARLARAALDRL